MFIESPRIKNCTHIWYMSSTRESVTIIMEIILEKTVHNPKESLEVD